MDRRNWLVYFYDNMNFVIMYILDHLMEILTLFIALGAIVTAIISYRYRPSKLDVEKRHSDDIKKYIVKPWLEQVRQETPGNPYEPKANEECKLKVAVESEFYFDDIKNHLPSELRLLNEWKYYKDKWEKYEGERAKIFIDLTEDISEQLGLVYDNNEIKNNYFTFYLVRTIFNHMDAIERDVKWYAPANFISKEQGDGTIRYSFTGYTVFRGDKVHCDNALKEYEKFIADIEKSTHFMKLKEIKKQYDSITKQREDLIKKLRFVEFIPLLPGKCKYIKWSLPGIIERIRKKL